MIYTFEMIDSLGGILITIAEAKIYSRSANERTLIKKAKKIFGMSSRHRKIVCDRSLLLLINAHMCMIKIRCQTQNESDI